MREENREFENKDLIIDWSRFKGNINGVKAKNCYIEFCKMLDEVDFELVSDYVSSNEKVELRYKFDKGVRLNPMCPSIFKRYTYKSIIDFKSTAIKNNDTFVKFIKLTSKGNLIAQIKTFDGGIININMSRYTSFNNARQDFYNKLKQVNGCTTDYYKDAKDKMDICIDDIKLNPMSPNHFKIKTFKTIINFKNKLKENDDEFIKFIGLTTDGNLIAQIKTFDKGTVCLDIARYSSFNRCRQDFYRKLEEVCGCTTDYYKSNEEKINICIEGVKLNPMKSSIFKTYTYKAIIKFKNKLKNNNDEFIRFVGLTDGGNLIAKIKAFDDGYVNLDIGTYSRFVEARQNTYNYCKENGYKILSPYVSSSDKMLIDFNCGHDPHWITPNSLKYGVGCPICGESKGEKVVRLYLENNNISFIQEYTFKDCKYKKTLPFDFYIQKYNLCIEFDGEQHYKAFDHFGGDKNLKLTKKRDKIKNKFCKDNGINLLRIPYYELDEIDNILDEEFERLRENLKKVC